MCNITRTCALHVFHFNCCLNKYVRLYNIRSCCIIFVVVALIIYMVQINLGPCGFLFTKTQKIAISIAEFGSEWNLQNRRIITLQKNKIVAPELHNLKIIRYCNFCNNSYYALMDTWKHSSAVICNVKYLENMLVLLWRCTSTHELLDTYALSPLCIIEELILQNLSSYSC